MNPSVTGMATEDGRIIVNPFSNLSAAEKNAVVRNESARLWMRQNNFSPDFELTPQQARFFEGSPYANNAVAAKQTIIARILSGDPSAGDVTDEQRIYADMVRQRLGQ